ncbi:DUF3331 domain-containing protein [Paraburkholderia pallida]|uniref:DUF3331 domain-containing protein n=2 Tax=Paraburkholderia pallida TaxID=2547399 RepID=A0A4P7D506_9BURK|nr:DUF3331 domain-containing protein [Paraburkholderia pallida]
MQVSGPSGVLLHDYPALPVRKASRTQPAVPFCGYIRILERLSSTAISLCWNDATSGHYSDQLWTRTLARRKAICSLTGKPINRGDAVYRPGGRRRHRPGNADRSILASALEAREAEGEDEPMRRA